MQSLKINIEGDFWDSHMYMNRLYIWTYKGSVKVINWEKFIDYICDLYPEHKLPILCAFSRGDLLYNKVFESIFQDVDIKKLITEKFEKLTNIDLTFNEKFLNNFLEGKEVNNPFKFLPIDIDFCNREIYCIIDNAFEKIGINSTGKRPIKAKPIKIWDSQIFSLKISKRGECALSGGEDGLYEYDINQREYYEDIFPKEDKNLRQLSSRHSLFSTWNFASIFSSSNVDKSYMAVYGWENVTQSITRYGQEFDIRVSKRKLESILSEEQIFGNSENKLCWSGGDKIYQAVNNHIDVVNFYQYNVTDEIDKNNIFSKSRSIELKPWKGNIINGGVAFFGCIVECENALVVLLSNNEFENIPGEITKWRIFPKSKRYQNHLHVIKEDKLTIHSFNQDYFVDQKIKNLGMIYNKKETDVRY
ncbi:MAG: hypothetical protein IAE65_05285 [Ignavibacteria bacterium]|nr:hypothetical protein [Ignavibacteria bacterium]